MSKTTMKNIAIGAFDIFRPIGEGGMGEVWEGVHREHGEAVAIKLLKENRKGNQESINAFEMEVKAIAALDHPGIVTVFDYGLISDEVAENSNGRLTSGSQYIAMELAHRGSLRKYKNALNWKELKLVLETILDALAHAHAAGFVHRDLKPSNILIGCSGSKSGVKLTDFGLAQMIESYGGVRSGWGTPLYMAPEQFRKAWREYGPWTDLYALGIMTFQLAAGYYPFVKKGEYGMKLELQG